MQHQWQGGCFCASMWGEESARFSRHRCPDLTPSLCGWRWDRQVLKLEQSVITQLQPHFMHWARCAAALRPGCWSFLCLFSRWNLRHELENTKQLRPRLPLWVLFPPPVGSWGKAKAVRSLQKKREISAGRVCMRQLICCGAGVPCSCWCDLLTQHAWNVFLHSYTSFAMC